MDSGLALRAPRNDGVQRSGDALAHYNDATLCSRDAHAPELCMSNLPFEIKGRRECRASDAPAASRAKNGSTRVSPPQVTPVHPAFPARWFYGLFQALPGDRAFLSPSSLRSVSF